MPPWALALCLASPSLGQETPPPEVSPDALISIRSEPGLPALSFAELHGFEGTRHLVPVLLPAESKYSSLGSAQEVQEALKVDPLLRDLTAALGRAVEEELGALPTGRDLIETLGRALPPILLAESTRTVGAYNAGLDVIALNWKDARASFPEAAGLDCAAFERWLLEEPSRPRRLVRDLGPILGHELAHARQAGLFSLNDPDLPNGGRYLEMEEEAYFTGMRLHLEAAEHEPALLASGSPAAKRLNEELFVFVWDLDRYLEAVRASYAGGEAHRAVSLAAALKLQRLRIENAPQASRGGLRKGRLLLERARRHYNRRIPELADDDWPGLSVRGMMLFARRDVRSRPPLAMALVYRSGQRSREQDELKGTQTFEERRPELERLFREAAWEDLAFLIARPGAGKPRRIRHRYADLLGELCAELSLDCREAVRDALEREVREPAASGTPAGGRLP